MAPVRTGIAGLDPRLAPTKRLLLSQIGHRAGGVYNRRAERLVLRAMTRGWADAALEQLLGALLERGESHEIALGTQADRRLGARTEHSLARVNGRGSAGQCPAVHAAKTPAAWERVQPAYAGASSRGTTPTAVAGGVRA